MWKAKGKEEFRMTLRFLTEDTEKANVWQGVTVQLGL